MKNMREPRNRVVQVRRFGGPDGLEVVDAPLPTAGRGEVRVRVNFGPIAGRVKGVEIDRLTLTSGP